MARFEAIRPGTDLSRYARELARVHDAVVAGARPHTPPRAIVSRSWARVLRAGLDPSRLNARDRLPRSEVERRRARSALSLVIGDLVQTVSAVADASPFLMVVTDADGVLLWRVGSPAVRGRADRLGFTEGARWTEHQVGTNAIGTALAEAAPVQLFAGEHFEESQHAWFCAAHPIHDPRDGRLLGIVDVSGPALTLHPAIGALVATSVRLAQAQLWQHLQRRLERLRRRAAPVLATITGPVLLVDVDGWVAHYSGVPPRARIEAPRDDTPLAVPGMGLCVPERLDDGWLVRPGRGGHALAAVLDLTASPVLEVRSHDAAWRTPLSHRHAEILDLLHSAGRSGLSAGQLSRALYGDPDHTVTVRAEISRMRRQVGALVSARPYRVADGVALSVTGPPSTPRACPQTNSIPPSTRTD
ncbi:GAF domain-containing protein [Xylanimonas ulmi]|uniref:GAF domain-containing protein n=1 Tax=Xylanimonas ulmi TaxID=228973 RepID=A0A4V2EY71_9MICO|nr:GAF domain-containing protein [Xylanibacterium ulmi]RZS61970.1 GAF domain-containing protein [Xylanibacterium ulmi]